MLSKSIDFTSKQAQSEKRPRLIALEQMQISGWFNLWIHFNQQALQSGLFTFSMKNSWSQLENTILRFERLLMGNQ
jgi:hypothetical protein